MPLPPPRWDGEPDTLDLSWMDEYERQFRAFAQLQPRYDDFDDYPYARDVLIVFYERFMLGNWLALADATDYCLSNSYPIPQWVTQGLLEFMLLAVNGVTIGEKGRAKSLAGLVREAAKVSLRGSMFRRVRSAQRFPADLVVAPVFIPREVLRAIRLGRLKGIGTTKEDALCAVEIGLRGTFASASLSTLRRDARSWDEADDTFEIESEKILDALGLGVIPEEEELEPYGLGLGLPTSPKRDADDEGQNQ